MPWARTWLMIRSSFTPACRMAMTSLTETAPALTWRPSCWAMSARFFASISSWPCPMAAPLKAPTPAPIAAPAPVFPQAWPTIAPVPAQADHPRRPLVRYESPFGSRSWPSGWLRSRCTERFGKAYVPREYPPHWRKQIDYRYYRLKVETGSDYAQLKCQGQERLVCLGGLGKLFWPSYRSG